MWKNEAVRYEKKKIQKETIVKKEELGKDGDTNDEYWDYLLEDTFDGKVDHNVVRCDKLKKEEKENVEKKK
jgi:hypothetical protein